MTPYVAWKSMACMALTHRPISSFDLSPKACIFFINFNSKWVISIRWYWEFDCQKGCISVISKPLTDIFNLSLSTGMVPEQLKFDKVIPIYKKEDPEIFSNYRPVSVLHCFSKILERLVFNRCMDHINKNNLLNEKQFGFRPNHSTYMAVIELVDKIANAVERNEPTLGVFLDLSKAFDTINHDILLYKLEYNGFRGVALDGLKAILVTENNLFVIKCMIQITRLSTVAFLKDLS